jgi:hypothetical protein
MDGVIGGILEGNRLFIVFNGKMLTFFDPIMIIMEGCRPTIMRENLSAIMTLLNYNGKILSNLAL